MKLYRYMSLEEFCKLCSGEKIVPKNENFEGRYVTESIGSCFIEPYTRALPIPMPDYRRIRSEKDFLAQMEKIYSKGCKLYYQTPPKSKDFTHYTPEECYKFLRGIVSEDVLVEFEVVDEKIIESGLARYADPNNDNGYIIIEEIFLKEGYSSKELKPTKYALKPQSPDIFGRSPNEWQKYNENIPNEKFLLRQLLKREEEPRLNGSGIRFLSLFDKGSDLIWRYSKDNGEVFSIEYGKRFKMNYFVDEDEAGETIYRIESSDNVPSFWKGIYEKNSILTSKSSVEDVFLFAALTVMFPQLADCYCLEESESSCSLNVKILDEKMPQIALDDLKIGFDEKGNLDIFVESPFEKRISLIEALRNRSYRDDDISRTKN